MWVDCRQGKTRDRNAVATVSEAESGIGPVKVFQSRSRILEA